MKKIRMSAIGHEVAMYPGILHEMPYFQETHYFQEISY
jgi:hypothetical protein